MSVYVRKVYNRDTFFPYTPSDLDPAGPRISLNQGQIEGIPKSVPFRTPA